MNVKINKSNSKNQENYSENHINNISLEVEELGSQKYHKSKIYEQVPIEESIEKFDIIESNNFCMKLKSLLHNLDELDKKISKPLQTYTPNFSIELIFFLFAKVFNTNVVVSYLIIILIYSLAKYKNAYLFLVIFFHVFMAAFFTFFIKRLFKRNRPVLEVKRYFNHVREREKSYSMPSGDSLQAGNFVMMIILYLDCDIKYFSLLLIPASMSGRVFYNCHYWFDCIIGAILGIIISLTCYYIINKFNLFIK